MGSYAPRAAREAGRTWPWAVALVAVVLAAAGFLLVRDHRYFFYGDTAGTYYGWWYDLGAHVRRGEWPVVDPSRWRAGNVSVEGQWGQFSPLTILVGLLATVLPSAVVTATLVKVGFWVLGSLGVMALARSYRVPAPLAAAAGLLASTGGMTQYLDLPSWANGLMIWALFPWVWWSLRRVVRGRHPLPALLLGYLIVTVGYVYGTIVLIALLGACLVEALAGRRLRDGLRVVGVGVLCGLVALAVYLPAVLTMPVTRRADQPAAEQAAGLGEKFTTDWAALFASPLPTGSVPGTTLHLLPYAHLVWVLPLVLLVSVGAVRRSWRALVGLLLVVGLLVAMVVGPSEIGPLRWPLRLAPFLTTALALAVVVLVSRCRAERVGPVRVGLALAWVAGTVAIASSRAPQLTPAHLVAGAVVLAGVGAAAWLLRARTPRWRALGGVLLATSALGFVVQHVVFPEPPSPAYAVPADLSRAYDDLPLRGDTMVVGDVGNLLVWHPEAAREVTIGSSWYATGKRVQNGYTAVSNTAYADRYCMSYRGATCGRTLVRTLFSAEPTTGELRVDLLGIDSLLLVRRNLGALADAPPPSGWEVARSGQFTVVWQRVRPLPGSGAPAWSSPGTEVTPLDTRGRTLSFRVDAVGSGGGRVVMSVLGWPGYHVSTGRVAEPVDGYLLTLEVPASAAGEVVTVRYDPPGWRLEQVAFVLALLGGAAWSLLARRRSRRAPPPPARGEATTAPVPGPAPVGAHAG